MGLTIWQKRTRHLTQALVLSGALNIALLATFCYFLLNKRQTSAGFVSPPPPVAIGSLQEKNLTNAEVLQRFCEKKFQDLVLLLENKQSLEEGYLARDFALAILVAFHQFNLDKAVGGAVLEKKQIIFARDPQGEYIDLAIFPGLNDEHFQAVVRFAKMEKWPLTSQGLFFEVKRACVKGKVIEASLLQAFYLTPEFLHLSTLMSRTQCLVTKESLLELICQGDWATLERHTLPTQEFSQERLREVLVDYLNQRAKKAAELLIHDLEFTVKRLNDEQVLFVLDEVKNQESKTCELARALLCSTRGERVFKVAASKLYTSVGEEVPQPFDLFKALQRFCPEAIKVDPVILPPPAQKRVAETPVIESPKKVIQKQITYTILDGDNLWKIAKKHRVTIEAIKETNHLESDKLRPGKTLVIPPQSRS